MSGKLRNNPCKDCSDRSVGCHARCSDYQSWRKDKDELNRLNYIEKGASIVYSEIKHNGNMHALKRSK